MEQQPCDESILPVTAGLFPLVPGSSTLPSRRGAGLLALAATAEEAGNGSCGSGRVRRQMPVAQTRPSGIAAAQLHPETGPSRVMAHILRPPLVIRRAGSRPRQRKPRSGSSTAMLSPCCAKRGLSPGQRVPTRVSAREPFRSAMETRPNDILCGEALRSTEDCPRRMMLSTQDT